MSKPTAESVNTKMDELLDLLIEDEERKAAEGKKTPKLEALYTIAGREQPKTTEEGKEE